MHFEDCKGRRVYVCDSSHKKVRKKKKDYPGIKFSRYQGRLHSPEFWGPDALSPQCSFLCSFVHNHTGTVERTARSTEVWNWNALSKARTAE